MTKERYSKMGLDVYAKGMPRVKLSYSTYFNFRKLIIKEAYGERCAEIFQKEHMNAEDIAYWISVSNADLDIFLFHSDCDGKFTPDECKKIYKALKPIQVDMDGFNEKGRCNMLDQWKSMFKHCMNRRVNMYYQ